MNLSVEGVDKSFGVRSILRDISLTLNSGEIGTILGLSGCGKTTLLRIIAGLESADRGDIRLDARSIMRDSPQARNIGFVFQSSGVYEHLTVARNLVLPLIAKGVDKKQVRTRVDNVATRFGVSAYMERPAGSLSGGEAQRLSLAKALIRRPNLMLLDEPYSHLDVTLQRETQAFVLDELRNEGITTLMVTHNHQEAQQANGRVFFLDDGRMIQAGTWETLFRRPATARIARVVSFLEPLRLDGILRAYDGRRMFEPTGTTLQLAVAEDVVSRPVEVDSECSLFYRTESLLTAEVSDHENCSCLRGVVRNSFFLGGAVYCLLETADGLRFQARVPDGCRNDRDSVQAVHLTQDQQVLLCSRG